MITVLERAKAHFSNLSLNHLDVPEWGDEGKPLQVHYRALSIAERRKIWRLPNGTIVDGTLATVRAVLFQARNAEGQQLFDEMDEHSLTYDVDSDVVSRVGAVILGFVGGKPVDPEEGVESAKKS